MQSEQRGFGGWRARGAMLLWCAVTLSSCQSADVVEGGCILDEDCERGQICTESRCVESSWEVGEGFELADEFDLGSGVGDDGGTGITSEDKLCVKTSREVLDFGVVPAGRERIERVEIENCSEDGAPFLIHAFDVESDPSGAFALTAWSIGATPFSLAAGERAFVEVRYASGGRSARAALSFEVAKRAESADVQRVEVTLLGESVMEPLDNTCPVASGTGESVSQGGGQKKSFDDAKRGEFVLDGTLSYDRDEGGEVVSYRWSVASEPFGVGTEILDAREPIARVTLDEIGFYVLSLRVHDQWGKESCRASEVRVRVVE